MSCILIWDFGRLGELLGAILEGLGTPWEVLGVSGGGALGETLESSWGALGDLSGVPEALWEYFGGS